MDHPVALVSMRTVLGMKEKGGEGGGDCGGGGGGGVPASNQMATGGSAQDRERR